MAEEASSRRMRKTPSLHVAIIGLSNFPHLLQELRDSSLDIVAVADFNSQHPALQEARKHGIFVSQDYTEILERPDLDLVLNLVPDETVEAIVNQLKPDRALVIGSSVSSLLKGFSDEFLTRRALLDILADVSRLLSGFLDQSALLGRVLQRISHLANSRGAGVWVRRGETFFFLNGFAIPTALRRYNPQLGTEGPLDRLMEERIPFWLRDVASEQFTEGKKAILEAGFRGLFALPIIRDFEVQGALILFQDEPLPIAKNVVQIMQALGDLIAQILRREGVLKGSKDLLIQDELTGLYNEVFFLDRLKAEIRRSNRSESPLSLLFVAVRPEHLADCTEQMIIRPHLRAMAAELLASIRGVDVPARCKQTDLAVILPDTASGGAINVARRLVERFSGVRPEGAENSAVKLSVGVATYPEHGATPKELLDNAELAAFLAIREGHEQIHLSPTGRADLDLIAPEAIIAKYPMLSDLFQVLAAQGDRDKCTFVHSREVARHAFMIARELGLPPQRVLEIGVAGWLHDVGKMTLAGLNGGLQQRLSQLPALNLKLHPTIGAYILKNLLRSPAILKGVLYHHATFDGADDPSSPHGEDIPLEARIVAVANAYQHLQGTAAGETIISRTDLMRDLRKKAGSELDPALVECLIRGITVA
jgi:diguanylate cyclase (GGDEF)-like protein